MKQKYDIGIIGAGLSGLTLGNSLLSKKIKNFILIEKNSHLKNDKTYSFWSGPGLFDIKKSFSVKPKKEWSQIEIKVKNKNVIACWFLMITQLFYCFMYGFFFRINEVSISKS